MIRRIVRRVRRRRAPTGRPLRIGMLRIAQESNALSPRLTELDDFGIDMSGDALMQATSRGGQEAPGFLKNAELSGFRRAVDAYDAPVEVVPLFSLWAVPAGPLSHRATAAIRARLRAALEAAGALDGLFVSLHGAMVGEDGTAPEELFLADIRDIIGDEPVVAVTIDLHACLTAGFMEPIDILAAYRTNPHRDHATCGRRCGTMLLDALSGRLRPTMAWRSLPMALGGGTTLDFLSPMRGIFRWMKQVEQDPAVRYVSLCMVHMWLDDPHAGWATAVVTDDDQAKAEALAEQLADKAWAVRHQLPPELPSPEEAIAEARQARLRRRAGTICMSDASDMVGAGAPGDNTQLLRALLEHGRGLRIYAPIRDDDVVSRAWGQPIGTQLDVTLGGRHPHSPPLPVSAVLRSQHETVAFRRVVVLTIDHLQLVVTSAPPLAMKPSFYRDVGLRPSRADICVVKSLFPFRLYFALHNRKTIYAKTEGATDFDAAWRCAFAVPTHPRDEVEAWRPADRARRGLAGPE
jgi:microcystin degradation protein MlrC